jgi:hypothetical protein
MFFPTLIAPQPRLYHYYTCLLLINSYNQQFKLQQRGWIRWGAWLYQGVPRFSGLALLAACHLHLQEQKTKEMERILR